MQDNLSVNIRKLIYRFHDLDTFRLRVNDFEYSFNGVLGMYGLSGSGKTTFSKILAGIIQRTPGSVSFSMNGIPVVPKIIYSPQFPEKILLGIHIEDTVRQIISRNKSASTVYDSICDYLQKFSLDFDKIRNKSGFELSGGELRRLAIALSLALSPDLLILDEPTIGLGRRGKMELFTILKEFREQHQLMIVSHDFNLIRKICRHFWILHRGNLIFTGDLQALERRQDIIEKVGIYALENYLAATMKSEEMTAL